MKNIILIDGGPRRNMNTSLMLQKFAEGAKSAGEHIERIVAYNKRCRKYIFYEEVNDINIRIWRDAVRLRAYIL